MIKQTRIKTCKNDLSENQWQVTEYMLLMTNARENIGYIFFDMLNTIS
jgi:hypothetical protein